LRKATVSYAMSVRPSLCPHETTWLPSSTDFHEIWYLNIFRKSVGNFKCHQNPTRITGTLYEAKCTFWSHLALFFLEWAIFQTKAAQNVATHILCLATIFENIMFMT
jgi:hypothetical protein